MLELLLQILRVCRSENDSMASLSELLTVASSTESKRDLQENVSSSVCFFTMSNRIWWVFLPFRDGNTGITIPSVKCSKCGKKRSVFSTALEVPCLEVKGNTFPPSSESQFLLSHMMENCWNLAGKGCMCEWRQCKQIPKRAIQSYKPVCLCTWTAYSLQNEFIPYMCRVCANQSKMKIK